MASTPSKSIALSTPFRTVDDRNGASATSLCFAAAIMSVKCRCSAPAANPSKPETCISKLNPEMDAWNVSNLKPATRAALSTNIGQTAQLIELRSSAPQVSHIAVRRQAAMRRKCNCKSCNSTDTVTSTGLPRTCRRTNRSTPTLDIARSPFQEYCDASTKLNGRNSVTLFRSLMVALTMVSDAGKGIFTFPNGTDKRTVWLIGMVNDESRKNNGMKRSVMKVGTALTRCERAMNRRPCGEFL
mmetsp:Transcript_42010/g.126898  ORF Transcript_42010/g.126898 Transcript_42010/m.126898 type:complete len:243 (-) Transcript_42010:252-980(-)